MKDASKERQTKRGFTILELLVVISIIAIIATLATGAAVKSMQQSRSRRIEAMAKGLEIALANYRAKENAWPFSLSDCDEDPKDESLYWLHGANNKKAFKKLYHGKSGLSKVVYLDAGAFMAYDESKGRMTLKAALEQRLTDVGLGYNLPKNTSMFCHFCICYNQRTDTVKVIRPDEKKHWEDIGSIEGWCPDPTFRRWISK